MPKTIFLIDQQTKKIVNSVWVSDTWPEDGSFNNPPDGQYIYDPSLDTSMGIGDKHDVVLDALVNEQETDTKTTVYHQKVIEYKNGDREISKTKIRDKTPQEVINDK